MTFDPETDLPVPETKEAAIIERNNWVDTAAHFSRGEDYYRDLLDQIAVHLGPEAYIADDGGVHDSPIRAKLPEMVKVLVDAAKPQ